MWVAQRSHGLSAARQPTVTNRHVVLRQPDFFAPPEGQALPVVLPHWVCEAPPTRQTWPEREPFSCAPLPSQSDHAVTIDVMMAAIGFASILPSTLTTQGVGTMPGTSCKALQREAPFRTGSSPHLQPTPAEHRRRGFLPHSQGFEIRERHRSRSRCWSRARCSDCQREGSTTPASRCSLTWSLSVGWKIEPAPKFDRDRTPHVQHDLGPNSHHGAGHGTIATVAEV